MKTFKASELDAEGYITTFEGQGYVECPNGCGLPDLEVIGRFDWEGLAYRCFECGLEFKVDWSK